MLTEELEFRVGVHLLDREAGFEEETANRFHQAEGVRLAGELWVFSPHYPEHRVLVFKQNWVHSVHQMDRTLHSPYFLRRCQIHSLCRCLVHHFHTLKSNLLT